MIGKIGINTDKTREEIACAWLLKQKDRKLSNTNVECFADGFRIARELTTSFSDSFPRIIKELRGIRHERMESAGYSGRYWEKVDGDVSVQAEKIADLMEALKTEIEAFNKICNNHEKL